MRRNQVFVFAMALAAATAAQDVAAQQEQGHEQHAGEARRQPGGGRHQRLFQGVELTAAQQQQIRAIFEEGRPARPQGSEGQRGERRPLAEGKRREGAEGRQRGERPRLTPEQRAQFQQRRQQHLARIRAVLTPEQRAQFDRNVAQQEARRGEQAGRRGGRRGGGRQS